MGDTRDHTRSHTVVAVTCPAVRRGGGRHIEREGLLHVRREERLQQPRCRLTEGEGGVRVRVRVREG